MKGNDGTGNVEERDDWETPQWLFDILEKQYGFDTDCCASEINKKCDTYWSNNFLEYNPDKNYDYIYWMNPPFSKAYDMFSHFFQIAKQGVCIYRCDNMETKIWQNLILRWADWIFIPKGRWAYEGKVGKGSRFPSALIGFNIEPPRNLDGTTLFLKTTEDNNGTVS